MDTTGLDGELADDPRNIWCKQYGLTTWASLFTARQLVALTAFSDLVGEARERIRMDAIAAGLSDDQAPLAKGGHGAEAYADAVAIYLSFAISKLSDRLSVLTTWYTDRDSTKNTFARQALPMVWDFAETNPLNDGTGTFANAADWTAQVLDELLATGGVGSAKQSAAETSLAGSPSVMVATDPPYYDNIAYADLSDFFYVWLRRALGASDPGLFRTMLTPKTEELIATPYRFGGSRAKAEEFFRDGLNRVFGSARQSQRPDFPMTVFYAFKQTEESGSGEEGISTGWETMLTGLVGSGFQLTGTWPMRTEQTIRFTSMGNNALASSIVLVCYPRPERATSVSRAEFLDELSKAMREALPVLSSGKVAPVDLAQASIGPGMAVYSKYSSVVRQDGKPVTVRAALQDINNAVSAYRNERVSSFDPKTRFCIDFYDQFGFAQAEFDNATVLARAQAVGVDTLENEHLLVAERGKAWLVPLKSYPVGVAGLERRFGGSAWEACMRLAATLQEEGEAATAALARELGEGVCARARELAVWLYTIADARRRPQDALGFNALDASWPEIQRLMAAMDRGGQQGRFA